MSSKKLKQDRLESSQLPTATADIQEGGLPGSKRQCSQVSGEKRFLAVWVKFQEIIKLEIRFLSNQKIVSLGEETWVKMWQLVVNVCKCCKSF